MLTPIDIQNHTLKTSMSGYNKKDTEEFLASILDSYETLFRENRTLKEKITSLSEGIQYYKQMENTLQKALILAEKTSTETQEAAKEQADTIIKDAQAKADLIIKDIKAEADEMKAEKENAVKEAEEKAGQLIREAETRAGIITKEAEEKAALIISDAGKQASDIKSHAQDELDGIRINAIRLVQDYEHYCHQVKKLAKAQLELLESDGYKFHVTELDIYNTENNSIQETGNDNTENGSMQETGNDNIESSSIQETGNDNIESGSIQETGNDNIESGSAQEAGNNDTEDETDQEKFSWNAATPFTFIDPE